MKKRKQNAEELLRELEEKLPIVRAYLRGKEATQNPIGYRGDLVLRVPEGDYSKARTLYIPAVHGNFKQIGWRKPGVPKLKTEYYLSVFNLTDAYSRAPDGKLQSIRRDKVWEPEDYFKATHYLESQGIDLVPVLPHHKLMDIIWNAVANELPEDLANQLPYFWETDD